LKPIFYRLNEIAAEHSGNFDLQLAIGEAKQHLVERGNWLKKFKQESPLQASPPAAPPPLPSPLSTTELAVTDRVGASSVQNIPAAQGALPSSRGLHPAPPPPPPQKPADGWKRAMWIGGLCGAAAALIVIAVLISLARKRSLSGSAPVEIQIATVPTGASVRVNGEAKCTSDCRVSLAPGQYQIAAVLDGYDQATSDLTVAARKPAAVNLPLTPQAQSLRILTDLDRGKVTLDDQPPVDLVEGQFVADRVPPGMHTVKVAGRVSESTFSFEIADAKPPSITGPVAARNLVAMVVTSFGNQAHVVTNGGPAKLVVNGQQETDAGPAGVDLKNFQAGVDEMALGEGKDLRTMKESFGPAPMVTAFLKTDLNIGTLIVSTGEDDVQVFLNNKPYPRKTQRGQLRIQTIGSVNVRVAKDGFDAVTPLSAQVKKGEETRLEFKLNKTPVVATLQVSGGTPGAQVFIDQRDAGAVGVDGSFTYGNIVPGDHTVDLRREKFAPKHYQHNFRAGQTFTLSGGDAALAVLPPPPPPPAPKKEVPVVKEKAPPPPPKPGTLADFDDVSQWHEENGVNVHAGAAFLTYKMPPKGLFTFTLHLLKGGKGRWRLMYLDPKNYAQFEIDNKNFVAKVITDGKSVDRTKTPIKNFDKQKEFTIEIDVAPEHIVHKLRVGDAWLPLDAWSEPGVRYGVGKFGLLVQGNDQIGLTDFKFQPK
jgi:hypothetical protein